MDNFQYTLQYLDGEMVLKPTIRQSRSVHLPDTRNLSQLFHIRQGLHSYSLRS